MQQSNDFANAASKVGFNTASGKHCCNYAEFIENVFVSGVSIPQAVSTVATGVILKMLMQLEKVSIPQAVSTVATCKMHYRLARIVDSFNTASGKHCCNSGV